MEQSCLSVVQVPLPHPDKGIIFCFTRSDVERLAGIIAHHSGQDVARYHSGMSHLDRAENVEKWKSTACSYIVATSGFGQGVDYPSVRIVIHYGLTHSLIDYAQETGRAGRDNKPADCIAIYSDAYTLRFKNLVPKASERDARALAGSNGRIKPSVYC
ncbi:hypothetical protein PHYSODRAFT_490379 [Phytophthora sojae]|uniref:DNA 3'-5' helicase n=1 Tax=Phytophthora sojae (strain P6497) TaxID=1094619 RepID=G4Z800_PHYSP|nr:hypothetical protein PHYSODRAFT_490379 [Phytophthora sojae]EGZ19064.1 hypothetical protein PHYSODRAFT_490379 [Phytophthora sojae]|eukprot:XP_009521781.1 hypothetical protein PHYSODRAFT_490379 [Phytophthora sojae]